CDPLALESKFTSVEESTDVLETTFVEDVGLTEESTYVLETTFIEDVDLTGVFPNEWICSVNLIFLSFFFGVTASSLVPNFGANGATSILSNYGSMGCKVTASVTTAFPFSLLKVSLRAVMTKTFS
nr:hypothetical protein [Tanacetum cinerariifolium]